VGASFGAALDVKLFRNAGLAVAARYRFATAHLTRQPVSVDDRDLGGTQVIAPGTETPLDLDVGGLRITAGARFYY
jgi:hypothetical protein